MFPDMLQFTAYFLIVSAAMRMLQVWLTKNNPESEWLKALAFIN